MVDGKTGGLRAAPRINSVSSTIRLFNLRPLRTRFSPTFPPSYARCFLLRASRKRGYDNFMTVVAVVGALHKRQFKSSSPLKRPLPLAKPGGNLDIPLEKTRGIIIGGMRRAEEKGKSCGWWREKRKEGKKNNGRRACKGEREGGREREAKCCDGAQQEKCQGLLPRPLSNDNHFYVTAIIRPFLLQQT